MGIPLHDGGSLSGYARGRRLQAAIVVEEGLDDIEAADTGRSFQIQARAAARKELGRLSTTVVQAANNRTAPVRTVDHANSCRRQLRGVWQTSATLKAVATRHEELGPGEGAARRALVGLLNLVPLPFDSFYILRDLFPNLGRDRPPSEPGKCFRPAFSAVMYCVGITRVAGMLELACEAKHASRESKCSSFFLFVDR